MCACMHGGDEKLSAPIQNMPYWRPIDIPRIIGENDVKCCFTVFPLPPYYINMTRSIFLSVITCFALSFAVAIAQEEPAQEPRTAPAASTNEERLTIETRDKTGQTMRGLKPAREFQGRLPNGFRPLVSTTQRDQIYKIQEEYYELIALLELRAELLKQERDAKIDAVLTPAQQGQLNRPVRRAILQR